MGTRLAASRSRRAVATRFDRRLHDPYPHGGLTGGILQRVEIDGAEALMHDLGAEPRTGWLEVSLGHVGSGRGEPPMIQDQVDPGAERQRRELLQEAA
jgi:hypothetical protein